MFILLLMSNAACAQRSHEPSGVLSEVDSLMNDAVASGLIPGGVVCVTDRETILYLHAYGNRQVFPDTLPMTTETVFDLASLSKPTSTAMTIFSLVADGKLAIDDYVSKYVPQITDSFNITHLLTHTSGLPPYLNVRRLAEHYGETTPEVLLDSICKCPRIARPGEKCRYSCLNFILLQHVIQNIEGKPLYEVANERIFAPLGMNHTTYLPDSTFLPLVAPTEYIPVPDADSLLLHGEVHDPLARVMNHGNSGNAGVFSCAEDLARLGMFLLKNKKNKYVHQMTSMPDSLAFSGRTLGWGHNDSITSYTGTLFGPETYCHTGYTGTSMITDPDAELCLIILTNRVHPHDKGNLNPLRGKVADAVFRIWGN
ncbi:MAG: beta-lactamase family protein [Paludibacteraceae bacterium]|nr:beta-lactamase family protein [Paludibacteraceae bacterium]